MNYFNQPFQESKINWLGVIISCDMRKVMLIYDNLRKSGNDRRTPPPCNTPLFDFLTKKQSVPEQF